MRTGREPRQHGRTRRQTNRRLDRSGWRSWRRWRRGLEHRVAETDRLVVRHQVTMLPRGWGIMIAMKRIAIVLTSHGQLGSTGKATGYYLPEASHAWAVFEAAGYGVVFVSPKGGAAPLDPGGQ